MLAPFLIPVAYKQMEIRIRAALRNRRVSMDADAAEKDADAFEVDDHCLN